MTRFRLKTAWLLSALIFMLLGRGSFVNGQVAPTSDATQTETTTPWYDKTTASDDNTTSTTASDETTSTTASPDNTPSTTASPVDTTSTTASPVSTPSTTASPVSTPSNTASPDSTPSNTASPDSTPSNTASPDNTTSPDDITTPMTTDDKDVDECASTTLNVCEHTCNSTDGNVTCGCNTGYIVDATDRTQCIEIISSDLNLILAYNTTCTDLSNTSTDCYTTLKAQVVQAIYQQAMQKSGGVMSVQVHTMKEGSLLVDATIVINKETDPNAASNLVAALFAIVENGLVINSTTVKLIALTITGSSGSNITVDANTDKCVILLTITTCENGCHVVSKNAQCIVSDSYDLNIPLIVGLSVGLPLAILLVAVLIYIAYIYYKKRGNRRVDSRLGHYEGNTANEFVRPNSKEARMPGDKTSDTGVLVP